MKPTHWFAIPMLACAALAGWSCQGNIGDPGASGDGTPGGNGGSGGTSNPQNACLDAVFQSSSAPLRRLSPAEYRNSVSDLFPGVALPPLDTAPDTRVDGFTNNSSGQSASPLGVELYVKLSGDVATAAAQSLSSWAPCSDDSDTCVNQIATNLATRAYRRPLDSDEQGRLETFATTARAEQGFDNAVQMVASAVLESPLFLFRAEFGSDVPVGDKAVRLSGYEMASRLSYFFLETLPDDELTTAARDGALDTDDGVRLQAERLMADPRSRPVLTNFLAEWMRLYKIDGLSLDPNTFPEFDTQLKADLKESARLYLDKALWEDDSWASLMTGSFGFVNDRLAPLFGVAAPGTNELVYVDLPQDQRSGILTQPGVLSSTSHGLRHSPIFRGVTLLSSFLCTPTGPADPKNLNKEPEKVDPSEVCTTRDSVAKTHTVRAECQDCHRAIDGAGFTFENYDALGRYRDTENGCNVDATGTLPTSDVEGQIENGVDLSRKLAASPQVAACMSEHLFRYALGRSVANADSCEVKALAVELLETDGDSMQKLIINLVTTPSFLSRPKL
ncbi:MAG: DUF1592 domain-containing protein [Polyangiaceae bacterium]|nr:DUF1592 domain-containing protein [Polyangiaceae bacterium]